MSTAPGPTRSHAVTTPEPVRELAAERARTGYGRLLALLSAMTGDIAAAEDALGDCAPGRTAAYPQTLTGGCSPWRATVCVTDGSPRTRRARSPSSPIPRTCPRRPLPHGWTRGTEPSSTAVEPTSRRHMMRDSSGASISRPPSRPYNAPASTGPNRIHACSWTSIVVSSPSPPPSGPSPRDSTCCHSARRGPDATNTGGPPSGVRPRRAGARSRRPVPASPIPGPSRATGRAWGTVPGGRGCTCRAPRATPPRR